MQFASSCLFSIELPIMTQLHRIRSQFSAAYVLIYEIHASSNVFCFSIRVYVRSSVQNKPIRDIVGDYSFC